MKLKKIIEQFEVYFNPRKNIKKDLLYCFENKHENEVDNLKQLITNSPVLKFYNPKLLMQVSCDASMKGLGAVLEQKHHDIWHPVSYASRSLTITMNYIKGSLLTLADLLSRAPLKNKKSEIDNAEINSHVRTFN